MSTLIGRAEVESETIRAVSGAILACGPQGRGYWFDLNLSRYDVAVVAEFRNGEETEKLIEVRFTAHFRFHVHFRNLNGEIVDPSPFRVLVYSMKPTCSRDHTRLTRGGSCSDCGMKIV